MMGLLALGLWFGIYDRLQFKDILAMGFIIFNAAGHTVFTVSLVLREMNWLVYVVLGLMIAGDVIKMLDLRNLLPSFEQAKENPNFIKVLYGLTLFYIAGYVITLVLHMIYSIFDAPSTAPSPQ